MASRHRSGARPELRSLPWDIPIGDQRRVGEYDEPADHERDLQPRGVSRVYAHAEGGDGIRAGEMGRTVDAREHGGNEEDGQLRERDVAVQRAFDR